MFSYVYVFPADFGYIFCPSAAASAGLENYGDSDIFADDWFGDASPKNSMHTVDKGRWAYLPVMEVGVCV